MIAFESPGKKIERVECKFIGLLVIQESLGLRLKSGNTPVVLKKDVSQSVLVWRSVYH